MNSVSFVPCILVLFFKEEHFFFGFLSVALLDTVAECLKLLTFGLQTSYSQVALRFTTSVVALTFVFYIIRYRRVALLRAARTVEHDKSVYDKIWQEIRSDPEVQHQLQQLQRVCSSIPKPSIRPRQTKTLTKEGAPDAQVGANGSGPLHAIPMFRSWLLCILPSGFLLDSAGSAKPVQDPDQLFAQARALNPILKHKAKGLALHCRGMFPAIAGPAKFLQWAQAAEDHELRNNIKWSKVKSAQRAHEKAARCYRCDCSLLVDLCRSCIVFCSVSDICDAITMMQDDPEIEIIRVKNRLSDDYNSDSSCGYRDVGLNLRIRNATTLRLEIDQHVAEIQLLLQDFAQVKSEEGHARYCAFRTLRAE
eukprot:CAMPEP_0184326010 /NCGR_PEP_ID=MMETSP1049-20130417/142337_1 /TAXON_ID=77928 /ORGANISM="Proteomonas sulcata, Strain CCMP704" /LENGTH=364 /DNA_ID=CAMNT_0026648179 /DNA_START=53 /DNA_END=1147 /DNA_ORIENTATION=-